MKIALLLGGERHGEHAQLSDQGYVSDATGLIIYEIEPCEEIAEPIALRIGLSLRQKKEIVAKWLSERKVEQLLESASTPRPGA